MVWWHAERIEDVQEAYRRFLKTQLGQLLETTWTAAALHRPAEFNKSHIPAFLADEEPKDFICVYPFVRSYEWYLLDDKERRDMLREHGQMARDYPDVRANTIASFALNDYEWVLAFEADELHPHRRPDARAAGRGRACTCARSSPFHTGRRVEVAALLDSSADRPGPSVPVVGGSSGDPMNHRRWWPPRAEVAVGRRQVRRVAGRRVMEIELMQ